jgi:outer membrane lipoprotein carrier protein
MSSTSFLRFAALSLILFYFCLQPPRAHGEAGLAGTVDAFQKRFTSLGTITGEFVQTYRAPGIEQRESGVFWMKKPALMRWEYRDPEEKLFVADGKQTWLYVPEDRQVQVRRFTAQELLSTPLRFLFGPGDIRSEYDVVPEQEYRGAAGTVLARLVPRGGSEYLFLVLEIDSVTFDLRRLIVREKTGNTSEFAFRNLVFNSKTNSRTFQFTPPPGVELIRQDER